MKSLAYVFAIVLGLTLMWSQAFAMDEPAPRRTPTSPELEAGRKAVDAQDYKSAIGHLTKAAQETPKDADVQNLLGFSYRKLGQYDKAMEYYQTALKLDSSHRGAHEYLGELYLEMDQPANADKELQALSKACPFFGKCEEYEDLKEAIDKYKAKKK